MENKFKTLCIVNPVSANGRTRKRWVQLEGYLTSKGVKFTVEYTDYPKEAIEITREAIRQGYNRLVAVGGDGTLNEVLNGFYNEDKQKLNEDVFLSFIPMGTGGDFARMFDLSSNPQKVYEILALAQEHVIDIVLATYTNWEGKQESRFFINVADVGLGSNTVHHVNRNSKLLGGFFSFLMGGIYSLLTFRNQDLIVEVDEEEVYRGKSSMIAVGNGSYFGGGMKIAPYAKLDDGLLDIIIVKDLNKLRLLRNLPRIYSGKHLDEPEIDFLLGRKIEIISEEELLLEFDGETPGIGNIRLEIRPKALKLLL